MRPDRIVINPPELAQEFNVTLRTVQRDLDLIQQGGFPLIRTSLGWQLVDGFRFRLPAFSCRRGLLLNPTIPQKNNIMAT